MGEYFSSQVKHIPFSLLNCMSARVSLLKVLVLSGVGSNGVDGTGEMVGVGVGNVCGGFCGIWFTGLGNIG